MLFSSALFLFLFLPTVLGLYYLMPRRGRNGLLLFASLFFYTWGEFELVLIMLTSVVVDYFAALQIDKGHRKLGLSMTLVTNLGLLCFFKYGNFAYENYLALLEILGQETDALAGFRKIAQPLGISFYTFQTLSYTLDVYWGKVKATRNVIDFATYVTLFPQLIAGPIIRYRDVHLQLREREETSSKFAVGRERFIIGLAKKVILANSFGIIADAAFDTPGDELTIGFAWMGLIAFVFQLYFDFAGYSDMAIGMGKMLGFDFLENFNYPYIARSLQELWRRWHISLSNWFRDYVYFPLRKTAWGRKNTNWCIVILFAGIGFWHGANWNFLLFGLLQAVIIVLERMAFRRKIKSPWRLLSHLYLIWAVCMSLLFFRSTSITQIWQYGKALYGFGSLGWGGTHPFLNLETLLLTICAIVLCIPTYPRIQAYVQQREFTAKPWLKIIYQVFLLVLFVLCAAYIAADTYNPFIYFRF